MLFIIFLITFVNCQCAINIPQALKVAWPPVLNNSTSQLINNYLQLEIDISLVSNRSNYSIIVDNCQNCNYLTDTFSTDTKGNDTKGIGNWIFLERDCNFVFLSNISLDNFLQHNNIFTVFLYISYQERLEFENLIITRNIENTLSILIYFDTYISLSVEEVIYINNPTDQFHNDDIVYLTIGNYSSVYLLEISINNTYLLFDGIIKDNSLIVNGNSFQFQLNVGGVGEYKIQILFENNSHMISAYTTINVVDILSPKNKSLLFLFTLIIIPIVFLISVYSYLYRNIKKINP
jgi:hypothetical protein